MTYTVVWRNEARRALSNLRAIDPATVKRVIGGVRELATDPYPEASNQLGGSRFWRLRLGELRITYEVDDALRVVHVYNVGPVPCLSWLNRYRRHMHPSPACPNRDARLPAAVTDR
jgi:mRNA interferase RelE/StbE